MFSLGRHISAKAAAQPKLRCTELDENGNVVLASGEFKKSELIAKVGSHEIKHLCQCTDIFS
jgi:magnesium transporter